MKDGIFRRETVGSVMHFKTDEIKATKDKSQFGTFRLKIMLECNLFLILVQRSARIGCAVFLII